MRRFPDDWARLSVVFSHDWLTGMRGGERVLEILCEGFPTAPIYTLIHNPSAISSAINQRRIVTSRLQNVPGVIAKYRYFLPFFPSAIERMEPPAADLLISSSHCVAKGLIPPPGAKHLCYCFTPMRYAWTFFEEYFGRNPVKAILAKPILASLREWDKRSSERVNRFVAISKHVQKRVKEFYGRDSDVVYPPVDTEKWTPDDRGGHGGFDLIVSALVPYKRLDLAIGAYNRIGYPLKIAGIGSETRKLRAMAKQNIEFLGWQSDRQILDLYRACRALVFPGEEDFGLVPLEAQACGKPVVAYRRGGVMESVTDGLSGVFFDSQTQDSLLEAIGRCASAKWDSRAIRSSVERFGVQNFIDGMAASVAMCLASR